MNFANRILFIHLNEADSSRDNILMTGLADEEEEKKFEKPTARQSSSDQLSFLRGGKLSIRGSGILFTYIPYNDT